MPWDHRNLADTVRPRTQYVTLPCKIGWAIDAYANGGRTWTWCHQWPRGDGNAKREGRSLHCGKTLADVRIRVNPRTGEPVRKASRLARLIATTPMDVPPIL